MVYCVILHYFEQQVSVSLTVLILKLKVPKWAPTLTSVFIHPDFVSVLIGNPPVRARHTGGL
ncbi:hypothetical protein SAMN05444397_101966 [Flavobacterium aquidurense]|nr:hypothetical protein SAMN05444397_101966 [Flavobacterium aquidurense]